MITPDDIALTDKMRKETAKIHPYPSTTRWCDRGEFHVSECARCDQCHEVLHYVLEEVDPARIAQHLVMEHGYTLDGLSPDEMLKKLEAHRGI